MDAERFAASRLRIARQMRGLKKNALAEKVGVSPQAVTAFESGLTSPSDETADRIAAHLGFPRGFFYGEEVEALHPGLASFRALRSMTASVRDRVVATGDMAAGIISPYLDSLLRLPEVQVPELPEDIIDATVAAEEVRKTWKLARGPIDNLIHLLESKGFHIYWITEPSPTMDAISFWQDGRPHIIVNSSRPGDRQRLSVGHEMGHLIFHRDVAPNAREAENEAFAFASNFLLPEDQFRKFFRATSSFSGLFSLLFRMKKDWGVSIASLLRRSRELDLVTEMEYKNAWRELTIQGMRKREPGALPREESLLHRKVFETLGERNLSPEGLAHDLMIPIADLLELMPAGKQYQAPEETADLPKLHLVD